MFNSFFVCLPEGSHWILRKIMVEHPHWDQFTGWCCPGSRTGWRRFWLLFASMTSEMEQIPCWKSVKGREKLKSPKRNIRLEQNREFDLPNMGIGQNPPNMDSSLETIKYREDGFGCGEVIFYIPQKQNLKSLQIWMFVGWGTITTMPS